LSDSKVVTVWVMGSSRNRTRDFKGLQRHLLKVPAQHIHDAHSNQIRPPCLSIFWTHRAVSGRLNIELPAGAGLVQTLNPHCIGMCFGVFLCCFVVACAVVAVKERGTA
jgi:hypothetical protein